MDNNLKSNSFIKKVNKRKIKAFIEYKSLTLSLGFTAIVSLILLLKFYDSSNIIGVIITSVYILGFLFQSVIYILLRKNVIINGEISRAVRLSGIIMVLFILSGNIFMFITGMLLINKNKSIEYQLSIYMILTNILIILVSLINIFKDYVTNTFIFGIYLLCGITIFYVFATILVAKNVSHKHINRKIAFLSIPLAITVATGNVFALILAILIFKRSKQKNNEVSTKGLDIMRRLFRSQLATIALFIIVFLIILSVYSNLTFVNSFAVDNNYSTILQSPSLKYPFGTDEFGRCVFTRIVYGANISLLVGIAATAVPIAFGGLFGAVSGYYSGKIDNIIMRFTDVLYAIPGLLLSIVIIASLGANVYNIVIALSVPSIAIYAKIVRATVLNISGQEFVEAAKAYGAKDRVIIVKHIIPNCLAPIIVNSTVNMGSVVLATSALSYLGIGLPSYIPEWGNILRAGSPYLETNPSQAIFSGLAIMLIVLAFNFLGDGLRDALDPKLK